MRRRNRKLAALLAALALVAAIAGGEVLGRVQLARHFYATGFTMWAGYTDTFSACSAPLIDRARGTNRPNHPDGLFRADADMSFYWFRQGGEILHEADFHLNNVGLMSHIDYDLTPRPDEFHIVVLGDEMTAASTGSKSWPDFLQEAMNADAELARKLGPVRVFNFGHPDAGPYHMALFWQEKARRLRPHLVIVNLVLHSFDRLSEEFCEQYADERSPLKFYAQKFSSPKGRDAYLLIFCHKGGTSLADRDCDAGRPFALWLPKELAKDRADFAAVQDSAIRAFLDPITLYSKRLVGWPYLLGLTVNPYAERVYPVYAAPLPPEGDRIEFTRRALNRIRSDLAPDQGLMVLQSPYLSHVEPYADFAPARRLAATEPALAPRDMRELLPAGPKDPELRTYWQFPFASEKFSAKGHQLYAQMVKKAVVEFLRGNGRLAQAPPQGN
jgi:hypothetical protein